MDRVTHLPSACKTRECPCREAYLKPSVLPSTSALTAAYASGLWAYGRDCTHAFSRSTRTLEPGRGQSLKVRVPWGSQQLLLSKAMSHKEEGGSKSKTFSNFVNCELVCFVFNVLNGGKIKVSGDATILLIEKLNCLPGDVHHACKHSTPNNASGNTIARPTEHAGYCVPLLGGQLVPCLNTNCATSRASSLSFPGSQRLKAPESVLPGQQQGGRSRVPKDRMLANKDKVCGAV